MSYAKQHLTEAVDIINKLDVHAIEKMAALLANVKETGGRIFFLGVGGSAGNCGHAVNPHQIAAQVEGGAVMGLSALLYEEMTVENGRIAQDNFHTYPVMRLADMPKIETVVVPTYDFWGGVGEPGAPTIAPAMVNAMFQATGQRIRSMPVLGRSLRSA